MPSAVYRNGEIHPKAFRTTMRFDISPDMLDKTMMTIGRNAHYSVKSNPATTATTSSTSTVEAESMNPNNNTLLAYAIRHRSMVIMSFAPPPGIGPTLCSGPAYLQST